MKATRPFLLLTCLEISPLRAWSCNLSAKGNSLQDERSFCSADRAMATGRNGGSAAFARTATEESPSGVVLVSAIVQQNNCPLRNKQQRASF